MSCPPIQFRIANKALQKSESYNSCQRILLTQELKDKEQKLVEDTQSLKSIKEELHGVLSSLDYLFITSLFLDKNKRSLQKIETAQNKKLSKILEEQPTHQANDLQLF